MCRRNERRRERARESGREQRRSPVNYWWTLKFLLRDRAFYRAAFYRGEQRTIKGLPIVINSPPAGDSRSKSTEDRRTSETFLTNFHSAVRIKPRLACLLSPDFCPLSRSNLSNANLSCTRKTQITDKRTPLASAQQASRAARWFSILRRPNFFPSVRGPADSASDTVAKNDESCGEFPANVAPVHTVRADECPPRASAIVSVFPEIYSRHTRPLAIRLIISITRTRASIALCTGSA